MAAESILVVGGYGVVGGRIAADLAEDFPDRVVVAGRNRQRADVMAATIGYGARGRQVEVTDRTSIAAALAGVQVVVNCIDQPDRALMWAAESVKIFWTPSCQLFCSGAGSLGGLIHATVGSLGGSGCRLNRSGLRV